MESFHKSCLLKAEAGICYLNDAVPTTPKKICFHHMQLLVDIFQRSCLFLAHSQNYEKELLPLSLLSVRLEQFDSHWTHCHEP